MKIKLNFKKVMLLVLAFTACNSQAGWRDWGKVFSFAKDSKVGVALQTYQPKMIVAIAATCISVCVLASLAWNKYKKSSIGSASAGAVGSPVSPEPSIGTSVVSECMGKKFKNYTKELSRVGGKHTVFINQDDPTDMIIFYHDIEGNINKTYYNMKNPSIRAIIQGPILGVDKINQIKIIRFFNQEYTIFVNDTLALTFEVKKD